MSFSTTSRIYGVGILRSSNIPDTSRASCRFSVTEDKSGVRLDNRYAVPYNVHQSRRNKRQDGISCILLANTYMISLEMMFFFCSRSSPGTARDSDLYLFVARLS